MVMLKNVVFIWHSNMSNLEYKGYKIYYLPVCCKIQQEYRKLYSSAFKMPKTLFRLKFWSYVFEILCIYYYFERLIFFFKFVLEFGRTIMFPYHLIAHI